MFINERYIATDKKYSIVVAHPDDEILWASSILLNAEKVIICFSDSEDNEKKSEGRKNIQKIRKVEGAAPKKPIVERATGRAKNQYGLMRRNEKAYHCCMKKPNFLDPNPT